MPASKTSKPQPLEVLGDWTDLGLEKIYGSGRERYSISDLLLQSEYKRALRGDIGAIKSMLRVIESTLEARDAIWAPLPQIIRDGDYGHSYRGRSYYRRAANADLALLILGIGAVDNEALEVVGGRDDPCRDERLRELAPNRIEPWVVELAMSRPEGGNAGCMSMNDLDESIAADDGSDVSNWHASKAELLAELMRARGPGATRFKAGKSGNPQGRPRKKEAELTLPFEDFLMELITISLDGKKRQMTRVDALFYQLMIMAGKGDLAITRLLLPRLVKAHLSNWKEENPKPPLPIRG